MDAVIKGAVAMVVGVTVVSILLIATGLHETAAGPTASNLLYIVIDVMAVWWVLKQRAPLDGYGRQVLNGLLVGLIAGLLIFVTSWLVTTVVFPDAVEEMKAVQIEAMERSGASGEMLEQQVAMLDALMTPAVSAAIGAGFTVITSLIAAAIIGLFLRQRA